MLNAIRNMCNCTPVQTTEPISSSAHAPTREEFAKRVEDGRVPTHSNPVFNELHRRVTGEEVSEQPKNNKWNWKVIAIVSGVVAGLAIVGAVSAFALPALGVVAASTALFAVGVASTTVAAASIGVMGYALYRHFKA